MAVICERSLGLLTKNNALSPGGDPNGLVKIIFKPESRSLIRKNLVNLSDKSPNDSIKKIDKAETIVNLETDQNMPFL